MPRNLVKLRVSHLKRMIGGGIAVMQPGSALRVRRLKQMQVVVHTRESDQSAHPLPSLRRIGREIEHNADACPQQLRYMRCNNGPDPL